MGYETILLEKENNIATITLNRPDKLNAIDTVMIEELTRAAELLAQDTNTHVVVITGSGKGFCSGGDLSMDVYNTTDAAALFQFMNSVSDMVMRIRALPQPVIAAVNGVAAGGGCNLALACDMIIAAEQARFSQIFVRGNLHPDTGGTYFLPRLVGTAKAMELLLTGRMVGAQEAEKIGMVNSVVPLAELNSTTMQMAGEIAKASPVVSHMIKASVLAGHASELKDALEGEARAQIMIMTAGIFKKP
jgi:2-(1,2-epoxy-1,2-dihydrophenyl)acetyl-CoA isomerase